MHTKLSNARSSIDLDFLYKTLSKNVYKYVGVTDGDSVHFFPYLVELSKKYNINTLLGCVVRMFDDNIDIFRSCIGIDDKKLSDLTFYVLDIVTNGAIYTNDDIIEIGWCTLDYDGIRESYASIIATQQKV